MSRLKTSQRNELIENFREGKEDPEYQVIPHPSKKGTYTIKKRPPPPPPEEPEEEVEVPVKKTKKTKEPKKEFKKSKENYLVAEMQVAMNKMMIEQMKLMRKQQKVISKKQKKIKERTSNIETIVTTPPEPVDEEIVEEKQEEPIEQKEYLNKLDDIQNEPEETQMVYQTYSRRSRLKTDQII